MSQTVRVESAARPLATDLAELRALHDDLAMGFGDHVDHVRMWSDVYDRPVSALLARRGPELAGAVLLTDTARRTTLAGQGDVRRVATRDQEAAEELARALLATVRGGRRLELRQLAADDLLGVALRRRTAVLAARGQPAPQRLFPPASERTEHSWAPKKFRQQSRQTARRLEETVGFRIDMDDEPARILALLPECRALRQRRETERGRGDDLSRREARRLQDAVVRDLPGRVQLWRLTVGGQLAAYILMVRDRGRAVLWDGRMEPTLAEVAPGTVLFAQMLRCWHADPTLVAVDFGRGDTEFKRRLRTDAVETVDLRAWSSVRRRDLDLALERSAERARDGLRGVRESSPAFAAAVAQLRGWQSRRAGRR